MRVQSPAREPSYWQLIFLQSKANGAAYRGDLLERHSWRWPRNTYLQRRLNFFKRAQKVDWFVS